MRPRRTIPAALLFALLGAALVIAVAGVPGTEDKVVTDGSEKLRKGWAEQRQATLDQEADER